LGDEKMEQWEVTEDMKTYGFMHNNGDLEMAHFTDEQIRLGELRAHIDYMASEGFTFMGKEVKSTT
jgi:hypothetical protein